MKQPMQLLRRTWCNQHCVWNDALLDRNINCKKEPKMAARRPNGNRYSRKEGHLVNVLDHFYENGYFDVLSRDTDRHLWDFVPDFVPRSDVKYWYWG
jgi:hypothetical protein